MEMQSTMCCLNSVSYTHLDVYKRQSVDGKTVTGTADSAGTITYTNTKDGNVPTGIRTETLPYLLTAGFALAGGGLLLIRRFRKKEADGG